MPAIMLQLEIEESSDEEEGGMIHEDENAGCAQSSSSSPSRRERKALTAAAFSNTSSPIIVNSSNGSNGGASRLPSRGGGGGGSPDCCFRKSGKSSSSSSSSWWRWCWCCVWLWNGGQSSSSSSSRWMRRFFVLGMSALLFYNATPANWNPVNSDVKSTKKNAVPAPHQSPITIPPPSSSSDSQLTPNHNEVRPLNSSSSSSKRDMSLTGENANDNDDINDDDDNDTVTSNVVSYSCPATVTLPENLSTGTSSSSSSGGGTSIISPHAKLLHNTTAYLSVFHSVEYDEMSFYSYDSIKQDMFHWKSSRFGDYLQDGDLIYESGCGIGLNLVMTLEILKESRGIQNLQIYGNDYSAESIRIAHELIQIQQQQHHDDRGGGILSPTHGQLGILCRADSAKLHEFVPRNTFDLVYTGYITPLQDALHLNLATQEDLDREYRVICQEQEENILRAADMQRRQEDWFSTWVTEMIRIAKPGAPVIVEQVSYPYCEAFFDDYGGVAQEFWKIAVERYKWDVNVESIQFENDVNIKSRYHVFMLKNNKQ